MAAPAGQNQDETTRRIAEIKATLAERQAARQAPEPSAAPAGNVHTNPAPAATEPLDVQQPKRDIENFSREDTQAEIARLRQELGLPDIAANGGAGEEEFTFDERLVRHASGKAMLGIKGTAEMALRGLNALGAVQHGGLSPYTATGALKIDAAIADASAAGTRIIEDLGLNPEPRNAEEQLIGNVAEETLPALIPFAGAAKAGKGAAGLLGWIARHPVQAGMAEALSIAGTGLGRTVAQRDYPDQPGVEFFLGTLGAVGPGATVAALKTPGRAVRGALDEYLPMTEKGIRRAVARKVQNEISGEAKDRAISHIDEAIKLENEVPGIQFSTVEATQSPRVRQLHKEQSHLSGEFLIRTQQGIDESEAAVIKDLARHAPNGDEESARILVNAMEAKATQQMDTHIDAATRQLDDRISESLRRGGIEDAADISAEASNDAVKTLGDLADKVKNPLRLEFDELEVKYADELVPFGNTRKGFNAFIKATGVAEQKDIPGSARATLRRLKEISEKVDTSARDTLTSNIGSKGHVPYAELRSLQRKVNSELQSLRSSPQGKVNESALRPWENLHENIARDLDELESLSGSALGIESKSLNRRWAKASERFNDGAAGKTIQRDRGRNATGATMDMFFVSGPKGKRGGEAFRRASEADPALDELMRLHIVAKGLRQSSRGKNGLDVHAMKNYAKDYAAALKHFPSAKADLEDISKMKGMHDDLLVLQGRSLADNQADQVARILKTEPWEAAKKILRDRSGRTTRAIVRRFQGVEGGEDALDGLRRAVWKDIEHTISESRLGIDGMAPFMSAHDLDAIIRKSETSLRALYKGTKHVDELKKFVKALARIEATPNATFVTKGIEDTSPFHGMGSMRFMVAPIYSNQQKWVVGGFKVGKLLRNLGVGKRGELMREALIKPQLFRELLTEPTKGNSVQLLRSFKANLASLGVRVGDDGKEEQRDE